MNQLAQGDILFTKVEAMPKKGEKVDAQNGQYIVAEGEATGHMHAIDAGKVANILLSDENLYMDLPEGGSITHQEHGTIDLGAGVWEAKRQREYIRGEIQNVAD